MHIRPLSSLELGPAARQVGMWATVVHEGFPSFDATHLCSEMPRNPGRLRIVPECLT